MEYILTICSRDKNPTERLLPAHQRYLSPRIVELKTESMATGIPALVLSGKFGLVAIDDLLPHYDHLLQLNEVAGLIPLVAKQLQDKSATRIIAYMKPRETDGWEPYYRLLESATQTAGVRLEYQII